MGALDPEGIAAPPRRSGAAAANDAFDDVAFLRMRVAGASVMVGMIDRS